MGWNGLDLVNDFASELGDLSSSFKTKTLRWINEGLKEIGTSHNWPHLREKGKFVTVPGEDTQSIVLAQPQAPDASLVAGGSLTEGAVYKVLVTFYESQGKVESIAGEATANLVPTATDKTIQITNLPVSSSPLVTSRRVYISKNAGTFQYYGEVEGNESTTEEMVLDGFGDPVLDGEGNPTYQDVAMTFDISSDSASPIAPPEEHAIHAIDGELYIENERIIQGTNLHDLIYRTSGTTSLGDPELWAPINNEEVRVYPSPSSEKEISFYYFKIPARVFGIKTSVPQLPSSLYDVLRAYVIWRGYDYRDRAGKESKEANYLMRLKSAISNKGKPTKRSGRVRSVTPDSDGFGV